MAQQVDERVVRMKFDSQQFDRGVQGTMSLLEKFEQSLKFEGAEKGINEVSKAARNVDVSPLGKAADEISVKFSAMSVAAMTAIQNLVNKAVDAGIQITKSLTLDQVMSGFDKYTDKTNAVQTIMNATGKSVDEVNDSLEKLQWFSDETSYSFVDMTSNVGKFTSAGIDLDVAVSAMQGIANAAADAGANSVEASRAMYNFSQALSKGYVQLIDWKSIENANMSTITFKQTMIDAAEAAGTLKKAGDGVWKTLKGNEVSATNFNEALVDGWLTNEALLAGLGKYSAYSDAIFELSDSFDTCADAMAATSEEGMELGARAFKAAQQAKTFTDAVNATKDAVSSGWMRTFEIIFGDFNQSVELWTNFTNTLWDVFASGGESRNEILEDALTEGSGWEAFTKLGVGNAERIKWALVSATKTGAVGLKELVEESGSLEKSWDQGWVTANNLRDAIIKISQSFGLLSKDYLEVLGWNEEAIAEFREFEKKIQDGTYSYEELAKLISRSSGRDNIITGLANSFHALESFVTPVKNGIANLFPAPTAEQIYQFTANFAEFTEKLKFSEEAMGGLEKTTTTLLKPLRSLFDILKKGFGGAGNLIIQLHDLTDGFFSWINSIESSRDVLRKVFSDTQVERIMTSWTTITEKLTKSFDKLQVAFSKAFGFKDNETILTKVNDAFTRLKDSLKNLKDAGLEGFVVALENIASLDIETWTNEVIEDFNNLVNYFKELKVNVSNVFKDMSAAIDNALGSIKIGNVGTLGDAIKNLNEGLGTLFESFTFTNSWKEFQTNYPGVVEGFKKLKDAIGDFLDRLTPGKVIVITFGVMLIAMMISFTRLLDTITGVVVSISTLVTSISNMAKKIKQSFTNAAKAINATSWVMIAGAIFIVASALKKISEIDPSRLWSSIGALGAIALGLAAMMGIFVAVAAIIKKSKEMQQGFEVATIAIIAIAGSVYLVSLAFKQLDGIDGASLLKSSLAIIGSIIALAISLRILASNKKAKVGITTALSLSISMMAVAKVIKDLSAMTTESMVRGILSLQAVMLALFELAIISRFASKKNSLLPMLGMILEVMVMMKMLKKLANEDTETLLNGVLNFQPIIFAIGELAIASRIASKKKATSAMFGIAAVLLAMQFLVKKLGEMEPSELKQGIAAVTVLTVLLTLMTKLMKTTEKKEKVVSGAGSTLMKMAIAMLALMLVVNYLGKLDAGVLLKGVAAVVALGLVMAAILYATKDAGKVTGTLISLGLVLGLAIAAIGILSLLDWDEILISTIGLGSVMLALGYVIKSVKDIKIKDAILGFFSIGILLTEVVTALRMLSKTNISWEMMTASATGLSLCIVAIGVALKLMQSSEFSEINLKKLVPASIVLGVFLAELIGGLSALTAIGGSWQTIISSSAGLSLCIIAVAEAMKIMTKSKIGDSETAILISAAKMMALFIIEIAVALAVLIHVTKDISWQNIIASSAGLSIAVVAVGEAMNLMSKNDFSGAKLKNMLSIAASMGLLIAAVTTALIFLTKYEADNVVENAVALGIAINAVSFATNLLNGISIGEGLGVALALGPLILSLAYAFTEMGKMDSVSNLSNAASLTLSILALTAMVVAFDKLNANGKTIKEAAAGAAAVDAVILIIGALVAIIGAILKDSTVLDQGMAQINKLSAVLPAFAILSALVAAADLLNFGAGTIGSSASFAASVDAILLIIGAFVGGVGALMQKYPEIDSWIDSGLGFLSKITTGIGEALGGFVGGIGTGITASLSQMADDISNFSEKIAPALQTIGSEEASAAGDSLRNFAGALIDLTASDILGTLAGSENTLESFGEDLKNFATPFSEFLEVMQQANINPAKVVTISMCASALSGFVSNLPTEGGWLNRITGENVSLKEFGEGLQKFAPSFRSFLITMSTVTVTEDQVKSISLALTCLTDFAKNLVKHGGWLQTALGETESIQEFMNDVMGYGTEDQKNLPEMLKEFSEAIGDKFDSKPIENATAAAGYISDFAKGLVKHGGIWQDIIGETQSVRDFMTDIMGEDANFADSLPNMLVAFCNQIPSDFDPERINTAVTAAGYLSDFSKNLRKDGGVTSWITGATQSIQSFVKDMMGDGENQGLADAIVSFSEKMDGVETDPIYKAIYVAQALNNFAQSLGNDQTWGDAIANGLNIKLSDFGSEVALFADNFTYFGEKVTSIDTDKLTKAITALDNFTTLLINFNSLDETAYKNFNATLIGFSERGINSFSSTFESLNAQEKIKTTVDNFISAFTKEFRTKETNDKLILAASNLFTYIVGDILSRVDEATNAGKVIADAIENEVNGIEFDVAAIGQNLIESFGTELSTYAPTLQEGITSAFGTVAPTLRSMFNLDEPPSVFTTAANELIANFQDAFTNSVTETENKVQYFVDTTIVYITTLVASYYKNVYDVSDKLGYNIPNAIINALIDSKPTMATNIKSFVDNISSNLTTNMTIVIANANMYGVNVGEGMASGIRSSIPNIIAASNALTSAIQSTVTSNLKIKSPSRVLRQDGRFTGQGFALGIEDSTSLTENAADKMTTRVVSVFHSAIGVIAKDMDANEFSNSLASAIQRASSMVENSYISSPVIRPILDLSDVNNGLSNIRVGSSVVRARAVEANFTENKQRAFKIQNGSNLSGTPQQTVIFNQTNTSPKSLNNSEIYRQTRNLLSQYKNRNK